MLRKIFIGLVVLFFDIDFVYAQLKMGLADRYSDEMGTDGASAEKLYKRLHSNTLDLVHPEKGRVSTTGCYQAVPLLDEGYTPLGFVERGRIFACQRLRDAAALQPFEHNLLNEDAGFSWFGGGLTSSFVNHAPASISELAFYPDLALMEDKRTWKELGNIVRVSDINFTRSPWKIMVDSEYGISYNFTLEDVGDYNGDGYADAVISYYAYDYSESNRARVNAGTASDLEIRSAKPIPPEKKWRLPLSGHFILTRTSETDGDLSLVKLYHGGVFNNVDIHELEQRYAEGDTSLRRDIDFIKLMLNELSLKSNYSNVASYNNIAFYLERDGYFESAIYLLEEITNKFPDRVVAYINLGDAYWGLGQQEEAREAYQTYIRLMRESNREQRIPQRVFERTGE